MTNQYKQHADKIRKLYPKWDKCSDLYLLSLYTNINEQQLITEYLSHTINSEVTLKELEKRFSGKYNSSEEITENQFITISFNNNQFKNILEINNYLNSFGWYPAIETNSKKSYNYNKLIDRYNRKFNFVIGYRSKFNDIKAVPTAKYLYHLTPDIFIKKIDLFGLTPRTKAKLSNHPERIYLLNPVTDEEFYEISLGLFETVSGKARELIEYYYLLQIDVEKIKSYDFYEDPDFKMGNGGVWIYQNIPPSYIKNIKKFLVNPK